MTHREMYERAVSALNPTEEDGLSYGMVAAALESAGGKVYVGVNVDLFWGWATAPSATRRAPCSPRANASCAAWSAWTSAEI